MSQMISDFVMMLFAMTLAGTGMYILLRLIHRKFYGFIKASEFCVLLRIMAVFFLCPMAFGMFFWIRAFYVGRTVPMQGEDFHEALVLSGLSKRITVTRYEEWQRATTAVFLVWLAGALIFLAYRIWRGYAAIERLKKASGRNTDKNTEIMKNKIMVEFGIKGSVDIYWSRFLSSPFFCGIREKKIFLPREGLSKEDLNWVLRHELVHAKNHDILFMNVLIALQAAYWFNPALCSFAEYFLDMSEISCDERVLTDEGRQGRYDYARLLLRLMEKKASVSYAVYLAKEKESNVERRICYIMEEKKMYKKGVFGVMLAVCLTACPATVLGATYGAMAFETYHANRMWEENMVEVESIELGEFQEETGILNEQIPVRRAAQELRRGGNPVDCTLYGKERYEISSEYLEVGDKVQFVLAGYNTTDKFRAGIADENKKTTSVASSNGTISYTITVKTAG